MHSESVKLALLAGEKAAFDQFLLVEGISCEPLLLSSLPHCYPQYCPLGTWRNLQTKAGHRHTFLFAA